MVDDPLRTDREKLAAALDPEARRAFEAWADPARRASSAAALKALYARDPRPATYDALRVALPYPEFAALAPPPDGSEAEFLPRRAFAAHLPGILVYPFRSVTSVAMILVGGPVFVGSLLMMQYMGCVALIFIWAVAGYLAAYLFDVMLEGGEGRAAPPRRPLSRSALEYVGHFFRWLAATFVSSFPALVLLGSWLGIAEERGRAAFGHPLFVAAAAAGVVGACYHPMALMLAGFTGRWWMAANVPLAARSIRRLGADYAICLGFCLVAYAAAALLERALAPVAAGSDVAYVLVQFPISWATFAMYVVQMRALGLLYYARGAELGWDRPEGR